MAITHCLHLCISQQPQNGLEMLFSIMSPSQHFLAHSHACFFWVLSQGE